VTRLLALCLLLAAPAALAQAQQPSTPAAPPPAAEPQSPAKPQEQPSAPDQPAAAPSAQPPASSSAAAPNDREQLKREVLDDVHEALDQQREQLREEIRAQLATQQANRVLEEEFQYQEDRRRLELFELDGYYRLRPELFYNLDLGRGADASGNYLFPRPALGGDAKTLADANMRWRLEPTLNVSEDVRLRAQIDVFDNLVLGATPVDSYQSTPDPRYPIPVTSRSQVPTQAALNWNKDSILARRVYGEVVTPVGQFLFGRMGSQWGMGILTSGGNCIYSDYGGCDFGDTVDRLMFVSTPIAGHYIVPFIDFVGEGPTSIRLNEAFATPVDLDQRDDATDYGLTIAKRDTDLEIRRKLGAGQSIINYGLYFIYRTQRFDAAGFDATSPFATGDLGFIPRDASFYIPDLWAKYQTNKLRLEIELAGTFGTIGNAALVPGTTTGEQALTVAEYGGAAQAEYKALESLNIGLEAGFASGDKAPGMGVFQGRPGVPQAGAIDGPQFCLADNCPFGRDSRVTNFQFNPA
jgi:uncharacterized protein (TIGR04551 family)